MSFVGNSFSFVIVDESQSHAVGSEQLTQPALERVANAIEQQLNNHVAPHYGGGYAMRVGTATDIKAGEIVCALVDSLPAAPGAVAYHDVNGNDVPTVYLALSLVSSVMNGSSSLSSALSHEACETAGDPGCNLWAQADNGRLHARELSDACQSNFYDIDGVSVSDFLLPSFWDVSGKAPYCYTASQGSGPDMSGPLKVAAGGYEIIMHGGSESQVTGKEVTAKQIHWASRASRRGVKFPESTDPEITVT